MNLTLTAFAIVFAVLRITGEKSQAYQAFAHLFVGGLFGAAWVGFAQSIGTDAVWWISLAVSLSLVELTVFLVGFFRTTFRGLG